jgi:hypothetical protein
MLRLLWRFARFAEPFGDGERLGWRFDDGVVSRWWWWCRREWATLSALASLLEPRKRSSREMLRLRRRVRSLLKLLSRERARACFVDGRVLVSCARCLEESLAARGDDALVSLIRSRGRSLGLSLSLLDESSGLH